MDVYESIRKFKDKYPMTVAWRIKRHAKVVEKHLNTGEVVKYAFAAQKNDSIFDFFSTHGVVLTDRRILLASKRVLFGYLFTAITPDMFNDLEVKAGIIWGKVTIDTVKEKVVLSNVQKSALEEIETKITEYMMEEKRKYGCK